MDGRDLLEILKSDIQLCHVPVVVFTTSANASDIFYCYSHYANGYHLKPMDLDQFETDVRALLDYWFTRVVTSLPRD
jgi:CheY-like chemotaxis protein